MTTQSKFSATLDSRNFFVSIISLVLITIAQVSGGVVPEGAAGQILDAISQKDIILFFTIALPNLINPIMKIVRDKLWTWKVFKSTNFLTQSLTVVLMGLAGFGIMWPDGAAANIVNAIAGGTGTVIITALVINIINPLYHFFFDKPKEPTQAKS